MAQNQVICSSPSRNLQSSSRLKQRCISTWLRTLHMRSATSRWMAASMRELVLSTLVIPTPWLLKWVHKYFWYHAWRRLIKKLSLFIKVYHLVLQMHRQHSATSVVLGTDHYSLTVFPNVDYVFISALVVILQELHTDKNDWWAQGSKLPCNELRGRVIYMILLFFFFYYPLILEELKST